MRPEHRNAIHDGGPSLSGGRPDNIHRDKRLKFEEFTAPARQPGSFSNISNANACQVVNVLRMIADRQPELVILQRTGISDTLYEETLDLLEKLLDLYRPVVVPDDRAKKEKELARLKKELADAERRERKPAKRDGRKTVRTNARRR